MAVVFLCGCSGAHNEMDQALQLRRKLLESEGCTFTAVVTADYGDAVYTFTMDCAADKAGRVSFEVTQPESIAGVTGFFSEQSGALTFDDQVLAYPPLTDEQITPVSSPWLLIRTLRSGYLTSCGSTSEGMCIAMDDSYQENALHLDIWTDETNEPVRCEILYKGRRILSMRVNGFTYL